MNKLLVLKLSHIEFWNDHFWLTREVIKAAVSKDKCFNQSLEELMQNQVNLGIIFSQLVIDDNAMEITNLLKEHIRIAVNIVSASINKSNTDNLVKSWFSNAKDIAVCYNRYNSGINYVVMKEMMEMHLTTTLHEATSVIKGDCVGARENGRIALLHIREMAEYINSKFSYSGGGCQCCENCGC